MTLDQAERLRRERVRLQAAELYTQDLSAVEVAAQMEVSTKSATSGRGCGSLAVWMRWRPGGCTGPDPKLSDEQLHG
ncbi:rRNA maturation endonuclease Nob1 [Hamadaea flava]|nr:rRNA maturation endonuclease Nob1 [Hamadaea flava]